MCHPIWRRASFSISWSTKVPNYSCFFYVTERDEQILKQVKLAFINKEIALALILNESVVKKHMPFILQKLQARNRVDAAITAHDHYSLR
jgi:two-component system nitrate/nitrite response regulator NarL